MYFCPALIPVNVTLVSVVGPMVRTVLPPLSSV